MPRGNNTTGGGLSLRRSRSHSDETTGDRPTGSSIDWVTSLVMFLICAIFVCGIVLVLYGKGSVGVNVINVVGPILFTVIILLVLAKGLQYMYKSRQEETTPATGMSSGGADIAPPVEGSGGVQGLSQFSLPDYYMLTRDGVDNSSYQNESVGAGLTAAAPPYDAELPPKYEDIINLPIHGAAASTGQPGLNTLSSREEAPPVYTAQASGNAPVQSSDAQPQSTSQGSENPATDDVGLRREDHPPPTYTQTVDPRLSAGAQISDAHLTPVEEVSSRSVTAENTTNNRQLAS